ncbi:MAG TPA: phosphate signaling complex protein PhoU [Burkholderiales bacterium]|jgi:phosphate transport system protein|nr:phosphate signaling complex protein PhoU [Burkholderiales bacterium]
MTDHSSKQYDIELETLRSRVLEMGGLVEAQIRAAIDGLTSGDVLALDAVIADDHRVNALEVSIDTESSHLIARRQPAASDLRLVLAIIKIVTDLERIGDEAAKIARMGKQSYARARMPSTPIAAVKHVGDIALGMLRKALDALARLDPVAAASIVREDFAIDEEFRAIVRQLITFMMEDPRTISQSLEILWIAKAIERIGDHAKNMAEQVIYIVKGTDVRHTTVEELEREALG